MYPQRPDTDDTPTASRELTDDELPQCKIKRNYSCNHCTYFTQNPRFYLTHLRDLHGERIVINKCNLCLYASRHFQKLVRHMKMVHGSTEGLSRKRPAPIEDSASNSLQKKIPTPSTPPALMFPIELSTNLDNLPNDLELSRKSLKDIAALYFAENQIDNIMMQMEKADTVQLPVLTRKLRIPIKRQANIGTFFDQLKKSVVDEDNLACSCGHVSKCFSEAVIHRKLCKQEGKPKIETPRVNLTSGSTRCQLCRRRCKSTVDLFKHMKHCSRTESSTSSLNESSNATESKEIMAKDVSTSRASESVETVVDSQDKKPADLELPETGLGAISKIKTSEEETATSAGKKVFKCPCCSFWASTASRFHVHIVGHLNRKPFKCSLCAYRSNWRWDITKHIRLKAIRNPYHRTARVIMSDEAGRRNYTKYNKYITLMKLSHEDGDPRQIRTGEMIPSPEVPSDLVDDYCKTHTEQSIDKTDALSKQTQAGNRCITPPFNRSSGDHRKDVKTDLKNEKFYNCCKCQFRHTNRDAVLAHVKIHHHSAESLPKLNPQNESIEGSAKANMNKDFAAALCLSPKHLLKDKSDLSQCNGTSSITSSISSLSKHDLPPQEVADVTTNPRAASTPSIATSPVDSVTDRSSSIIRGGSKSGMSIAVKANTNLLTDRKGPSPFRCGHCHQVSNWKHVIQRHCRLKHCGQIQIEYLHRTTDGCTPLYKPLDFYGTGSVRNVLGSSRDDSIKVSQQKDEITSTKGQEISKSKESVSTSDSVEQNGLKEPTISREEGTPQTDLPTKEISYCPKCPEKFVNSSKKLQQHLLAHGADFDHQCGVCDFSAKQKVILLSHSLAHSSIYQERAELINKDAKDDAPHPTQEIGQISQPSVAAPTWVVGDITKKPPLEPGPVEDSTTSKKCPYCFFESACNEALQHHIQHHLRISNDPCLDCDFQKSPEITLNKPTQIHAEAEDHRTSSSTENEITNKKIDSKVKEPKEKTEKVPTLNKQSKKRAPKDEEKPSQPPSNHKTILVNPKTVQRILDESAYLPRNPTSSRTQSTNLLHSTLHSNGFHLPDGCVKSTEKNPTNTSSINGTHL